MVSLIKFFLDPFNILWFLLLLTAVIFLLKKERLGKWMVIIAAGWFLVASTPLVPVMIINSLEDRYEPLFIEEMKDLESEYHIIVLGGGHGFDERLPPNALLSQNALGRLIEGIRLHRQLPNSKLVLSGFSSTPGRTTQAEMLQKTALLLGVKEKAILLQKKPGNTYEEVKVYTKNYGTSYPVILVTSATHMPRAMTSFNNFGIEPIPSPTNYRLKGSWKNNWIGLPSLHNMENMRLGLSEYAALLRYKLRN